MRFGVLVGAGIALIGLSQQAWAGGCCRPATEYVVECAPVVAVSTVSCTTSSSSSVSVKCCGTARKQVKVSYFDAANSTWIEADAMVSIDDAVVGAQVELTSCGKTVRAWVTGMGDGPKGPPAMQPSSPTLQGKAAAAAPAGADKVASLN